MINAPESKTKLLHIKLSRAWVYIYLGQNLHEVIIASDCFEAQLKIIERQKSAESDPPNYTKCKHIHTKNARTCVKEGA